MFASNIAMQRWYLIRLACTPHETVYSEALSNLWNDAIFLVDDVLFFFCLAETSLNDSQAFARVKCVYVCSSWRCVKTQSNFWNVFNLVFSFAWNYYRVYASLRPECTECEGVDMRRTVQNAMAGHTITDLESFVCVAVGWTWGIWCMNAWYV